MQAPRRISRRTWASILCGLNGASLPTVTTSQDRIVNVPRSLYIFWSGTERDLAVMDDICPRHYPPVSGTLSFMLWYIQTRESGLRVGSGKYLKGDERSLLLRFSSSS